MALPVAARPPRRAPSAPLGGEGIPCHRLCCTNSPWCVLAIRAAWSGRRQVPDAGCSQGGNLRGRVCSYLPVLVLRDVLELPRPFVCHLSPPRGRGSGRLRRRHPVQERRAKGKSVPRAGHMLCGAHWRIARRVAEEREQVQLQCCHFFRAQPRHSDIARRERRRWWRPNAFGLPAAASVGHAAMSDSIGCVLEEAVPPALRLGRGCRVVGLLLGLQYVQRHGQRVVRVLFEHGLDVHALRSQV